MMEGPDYYFQIRKYFPFSEITAYEYFVISIYCDLYLFKKLILSGPGAWKRAPFYLLNPLRAFSSCSAL